MARPGRLDPDRTPRATAGATAHPAPRVVGDGRIATDGTDPIVLAGLRAGGPARPRPSPRPAPGTLPGGTSPPPPGVAMWHAFPPPRRAAFTLAASRPRARCPVGGTVGEHFC